MGFDLGAIYNALLATFSAYSYAALFLVTFVAALAVPIPASIALAAAGSFAAQGYMNLYAILGIGLLGNMSADTLGYVLARRYGVQTLQKIGFKRLLNSPRYKTLKDYVHEYPQALIYITRLITEAGPAINILSGLAAVPYRVFILFDLVGEVSYVLLFVLTGYFLGDAWQNNTSFLLKGVLVLVSLGGVIGIAQIIVRRRFKAKQEQ